VGVEGTAQARRPGVPHGSRQQRVDRAQIEQPQLFGAFDRPVDSLRCRSREVEQGAREGCNRNPIAHGAVVISKSGSMMKMD
jgi:hypothetical protein